jgi:hypothetical protein
VGKVPFHQVRDLRLGGIMKRQQVNVHKAAVGFQLAKSTSLST